MGGLAVAGSGKETAFPALPFRTGQERTEGVSASRENLIFRGLGDFASS